MDVLIGDLVRGKHTLFVVGHELDAAAAGDADVKNGCRAKDAAVALDALGNIVARCPTAFVLNCSTSEMRVRVDGDHSTAPDRIFDVDRDAMRRRSDHNGCDWSAASSAEAARACLHCAHALVFVGTPPLPEGTLELPPGLRSVRC